MLLEVVEDPVVVLVMLVEVVEDPVVVLVMLVMVLEVVVLLILVYVVVGFGTTNFAAIKSSPPVCCLDRYRQCIQQR